MDDRYKETMVIGDILPQVLSHSIGANAVAGLQAMQVVKTWRDTLGRTMVRYSSHERFSDGTLFVKISSSAFRQELFMNRDSVISKINGSIGSDIVKQIVFS